MGNFFGFGRLFMRRAAAPAETGDCPDCDDSNQEGSCAAHGTVTCPPATPGRLCGEPEEDYIERTRGVLVDDKPHPASDPEWLKEKLAVTDDTMVGGPPPRPERPCDKYPGCNANNCLGCGEVPASGVTGPEDQTKPPSGTD